MPVFLEDSVEAAVTGLADLDSDERVEYLTLLNAVALVQKCSRCSQSFSLMRHLGMECAGGKPHRDSSVDWMLIRIPARILRAMQSEGALCGPRWAKVFQQLDAPEHPDSVCVGMLECITI